MAPVCAYVAKFGCSGNHKLEIFSETLFTSEVSCLQAGKYVAGTESQEPSKPKY